MINDVIVVLELKKYVQCSAKYPKRTVFMNTEHDVYKLLQFSGKLEVFLLTICLLSFND